MRHYHCFTLLEQEELFLTLKNLITEITMELNYNKSKIPKKFCENTLFMSLRKTMFS